MRKESVFRNTAPTGYVLSQYGHFLLLRIREHLKLLDRMTNARITNDVRDLSLTPDELLTHLFFLVRDMDAVHDEMCIEIRR